MIKNYIKMKKAEYKVKAMVYGTIADIADGFKEYKPAIERILEFAKSYSGSNFQTDFMKELAEVIHYDVNGKK